MPRNASGAPLGPSSEMVSAVVDAFFESPAHRQRNEPTIDPDTVLDGIVYVTGASGCGKSSILRSVALRDSRWTELPALERTVALIDLFEGDIGERLAHLAKFGLGDAHVAITIVDALSDGQLARAKIALAVARKTPRLIIDEFLSGVDRVSAKIVARNLRKLCDARAMSIIVATAHDDLEDSLDPDIVIRVSANRPPTVSASGTGRAWMLGKKIAVGAGSLRDYLALQRFHYYSTLDFDAAGREVSVAAAFYDADPIAARLYCAPFPRSWTRAVPEFARINEHLCLGQRLVVHPQFRGVGLARMITDAQFAPRKTIYTRSVMSRFTDFHTSLGYRRHEPATNVLAGSDTDSDPRERAVQVLMTEVMDYFSVLEFSISDSRREAISDWFVQRVQNFSDHELANSGSVTSMGGYVRQRDDNSPMTVDQATFGAGKVSHS